MGIVRKVILAAALGAAVAAPAAAQQIRRTLEAGFLPDPDTSRVQAGGPVELTERSGPDCTGFVTREPTMRLNYLADEEELFISATSETDTVLMVRAPDGKISCSDDRGEEGLDPGLSFENAASGEYLIWVGTYDEEAPAPAQLQISEIGFGGEAD